MSISQSTTKVFVKNRAEELGMDLWGDFIIPHYFDDLAIEEVKKPLLIEGGRGCGKTTLLRYLSYETQLSPKRKLTKLTVPKQIGIYYRSDTKYLRMFRGDTLPEFQWQNAFEHELCLTIAQSLLGSLQLLVNGERESEFEEILKIDFSLWSEFDATAPNSLNELAKHVRKERNKFSMWLNNPETERPNFLPLKPLLTQLIQTIQVSVEYLSGLVFFVFIDEYENLLDYQMQVINTYLKHSESPLIFHVATKRNGMGTRQTVGNETLQELHDFRRFDIEEYGHEDFSLFAAELFCFRLRKNNFQVGPTEINEEFLSLISNLSYRRKNTDYREKTIAVAKQMLPSLSHTEVADLIFQDNILRSKLERTLQDILDVVAPDLKASQFLMENAKMESICVSALLHQSKPAAEILSELVAASNGKQNKFNTSEWKHHYFLGSVYYLYMSLPRPCVTYAGFDNFIRLSRGNTRHFLELCHLSMQNAEIKNNSLQQIGVETLSNAARAASLLFIKETQGSGDYGNILFHLVHALGQIFRLSQARPAQSEPERTHFAISSGQLDERTEKILSECIKWSILFATAETKVKGTRLEVQDYVFNPIFAPYFGISFNKGRKFDIKASDFESLASGDRGRLDMIVKNFAKSWGLSLPDQMALFNDDAS